MTCAHGTVVEYAVARSSKPKSIVPDAAPRILLADDQEEVRRTVAAVLEREFQIVGLAENGKEVLDCLLRCSPNALVLDLFMPVLNGIETAKRVRESGSRVAVVMLTVYEDADFVEAAFSVGVRGYVLKPRIITDLIPAIRTVLRGRSYVSPPLHF